MAKRDVERLRRYLEMITAKRGGLEAMVEGSHEGAFESREAATEPGAAKNARSGLETMARGKNPSAEELHNLEAIILPDLRPAVDIVDGTFLMTHPLWRRLSDDAAVKNRIVGTIPSIGRIELPGHALPYGGTGFVVGDGLIMTNRHVAEIFAKGLGDKRLEFRDGTKAGIDFLREQDRPTGPTLMVERVVMIHPYWDMAILAVGNLPPGHKSLRLSLTDARDLTGHDIFVVGYPAFDPRNPADVQKDVFGGKFGVKRLQPGELQGGMSTASFGKVVPAATHDCSTLGGNSGSAVIDLDSGDVLALHFGGRYQEQNFAVPASELARDARVVAAGVNFAGTPTGGANGWSSWWARADGGEAVVAAASAKAPLAADPSAAAKAAAGVASTGGGSVAMVIPVTITVALGAPGAADARVEAVGLLAGNGLEAMREPFRDGDFSSRRGYDPAFLNDPDQDPSLGAVSVAMPEARDPRILARTKSGGDVLDYENFSIKMHAARRLALITASNVTKTPKLKRPEPGKDYTRTGLSGLDGNDQERWFTDPRLGEEFQIPDIFFTKDRGAFDKGHIVRRDDVAWGKSYETLRRANGDTYHVTNCSPQVAGFNRSAEGEDNWGDLENHVLSEAANERLCVFAGPVLDPADQAFTGKGANGSVLRARIPRRFWKVIVARVEDGIAAYGFVLEQDLADVDVEFTVPEEFVAAMAPIGDIAGIAGVTFPTDLLSADQYETVRGAEVARRAGARRKRAGSKR
ncbi:MAG: DNA/RNA non-specific endonuclease [Parvibaculaceae bacterium]